MNFTVEVPGEASPLSLEELARVLNAATSSTNNAERQSAGQQLSSWETHREFYSSLQVGDGMSSFSTMSGLTYMQRRPSFSTSLCRKTSDSLQSSS
jgi:hypothetical protein